VDGTNTAYTVQAIKGINLAFVTVTAGAHRFSVTYVPTQRVYLPLIAR
jgi:hypothetical protein